MTLRTDLADDTASLTVHAAQHNEVNAAVLAMPAGGQTVVRKFAFAYNSSSIATGHTLYTPTVGDILIDAWVEVVTAWNGTTPFCDVGIFSGSNVGWFGNYFQAINVGSVDYDGNPEGLTTGDRTGPLSAYNVLNDSLATMRTLAGANPTGLGLTNVTLFSGEGSRLLPAKFNVATPIKVVVTQNGTATGAATGASQGSAILYLITATPV